MSRINRVKRQLRKMVYTDPVTGKVMAPRLRPPRGRGSKHGPTFRGRAKVVNRTNPNAPASVRRDGFSLLGLLTGAA